MRKEKETRNSAKSKLGSRLQFIVYDLSVSSAAEVYFRSIFMECYLPVRRTRLVFQVVCFGSILVWIVFGTYMHSPRNLGLTKSRGGMKHLLSLSEINDLSGEDSCDLLFENGTKINIKDTEVRHSSCIEFHSSSNLYLKVVDQPVSYTFTC